MLKKNPENTGKPPSWVVFLSCFFYILTLRVGQNGDLARYGEYLASVVANVDIDWQIFYGYSAETGFALIFFIYAVILDFLFSVIPGYYSIKLGSPEIVLLSTAVIGWFIYRLRNYEHAVLIHAFICLDTATSLMPFNLVRQFLAFAIFFPTLLYHLTDRNKRSHTLLLTATFAALVHWTMWVYVLISIFIMISERLEKRFKNRNVYYLCAILIVLIGSAGLSSIGFETFNRILRIMPLERGPFPSAITIICPLIGAYVLSNHKSQSAKIVAAASIAIFAILLILGTGATFYERYRILFFPILICLAIDKDNLKHSHRTDVTLALPALIIMVGLYLYIDHHTFSTLGREPLLFLLL